MSGTYNTDQINAVWNRVTAQQKANGAHGAGPNEPKQLAALMDDVASDADAYRAMAQACQDKANRRLFLTIAADKTRQLQALQAAYFARVGDVYKLKVRRQQSHGLLAALQARYAGEQKRARAYAQAEQNTHDQQLKKLYKTLAADTHRHLEAVGGVIKRLMQ